jgi:DNA helicase II / ATP-dependent DNA helicase PcrA
LRMAKQGRTVEPVGGHRERDRSESSSSGSMAFVRSLAQRTARSQAPQPTVAHTPSADFSPSDTSGLVAGMEVEHSKFGFGTVTSLDVNGTERKATIRFKTAGEKTLLLSFAKLRIVA